MVEQIAVVTIDYVPITDYHIHKIREAVNTLSIDRGTFETGLIIYGGHDEVERISDIVLKGYDGDYRIYYDIYAETDGGCYENDIPEND